MKSQGTSKLRMLSGKKYKHRDGLLYKKKADEKQKRRRREKYNSSGEF